MLLLTFLKKEIGISIDIFAVSGIAKLMNENSGFLYAADISGLESAEKYPAL
jgi:hypothetical protein